MSRLKTINDAAREIGVSTQTIKNWIARGLLQSLVVNKTSIYVKEDSINAIVSSDIPILEDNLRRERFRLEKECESIKDTIEDAKHRHEFLLGCRKFMIYPYLRAVMDILSDCELAEREYRILSLLLDGHDYKEIAKSESITVERVRQIVHRLPRYIRRLERYEELRKRKMSDDKKILGLQSIISTLEAENSSLRGNIETPANENIKADPETLGTNVKDLAITTRLLNVCRCAGIHTLGDLASFSKYEFTKLRGCGKKSLLEAEELLKTYNLRF